jgi:hypothetical protein
VKRVLTIHAVLAGAVGPGQPTVVCRAAGRR